MKETGGYRYYYVEHLDLVGRTPENYFFASEVYHPGSGWVRDANHDISDRIMGYDPDEEPGWRMGNSDLMSEIRAISRDKAIELILRLTEEKEVKT